MRVVGLHLLRGLDRREQAEKPFCISQRECEVESELCVRTDRPIFLKSRVSDSARPTDRPAARSAARKILGRNTRPTDPLGPRPSRSEAIFINYVAFRLLAGRNDRPTDPTPTDSGQSDLPTDRPTQRRFPHAEFTFNFAFPDL